MAGDDGGAGPRCAHVVAEARGRLDRARRSGGTRAVAGPLRRPAPLGIVYLMAFLTLVNQGAGADWDARALARRRFSSATPRAQFGGPGAGFWKMPTLFWLRALATAPSPRWAGPASRSRCWSSPVTRTRSCSRFSARSRSRSSTSARSSTRSAGRSSCSRPASSRLPVPAARRAAVPAPPAPPRWCWLLRWLIVRMMLGRGADQAARRPVLDRPHLPRLPLRDATDPEPALAARFTSCRTGCTRQACCSTTSSSWARRFFVFGPRRRARSSAGALMAGLQLVLIAQRQPLVPELADARADRSPASTTSFCDACCRALSSRAPNGHGPAPRRRARKARDRGALRVAVALLSIGPVVNMLSNTSR